jgi:hypothetical protein
MRHILQSVIVVLTATFVLGLASTTAFGQTNTLTAGTTWTGGTWSLGRVPLATDSVVISEGLHVSVNTAAVCGTFTIASGSSRTGVTITSGNSLTVGGGTGPVTLNSSTSRVNDSLNVGAGTLSCGNVTINPAGSGGGRFRNSYNLMTISTGTANVNGSFSFGTSGRGAEIIFTGAGTLNLTGNLPSGATFTSGSTGTVNFNGSGSQSIGAYTYRNLTLSNAGTKTLLGSTTVNGTLNIGSSTTLAQSTYALTMSGAIVNNGILSGTGTMTVNGTGTPAISGTGKFSNTSHTFSISTAHRFANGSNLTFLSTIAITASVTVTDSGTVTDSNATSVTGSRTGSTWVNAANSTLNVFGTLLSTGTLTATQTGNTVNYMGTGAQTIKATNFYNLTSSSTGNRTMPASTGTAGTVGIAGTFTAGTNTYTVTGGTVNYNGTGSQTVVAFNYYNLTVSGARTTNTVTLSSSGTINIAAVFSNTATFTTGGYAVVGSTVNFDGTIAQAIPVFQFGNLSSSSTGARTLPSGNTGVYGSFAPGNNTWTVTGNTFLYNGTGAQTVAAFQYNNLAITGAHTSNNVTLASSGTITILGTFTATATFTSGGYVTATSTVSYSGTGTQAIGAFPYYNLTSTGTANRTLSPTGEVGVAGTFTPGSNAYTVTGSTVDFNGGTQTINVFAYNNLTVSNSGTKTAGGNLHVGGNLTINSTATFASNGTNDSISGNWTNNGTFDGTGSIYFNGANVNLGGSSATTFNVLTFTNTSATDTLDQNETAATLNVTGGTLLTGSYTMNVTSTRTGNGIILGIIEHMHTFTTGVAYEFEGPNNTITFSSVTASPSSIVDTVTLGKISTFPHNASINRLYGLGINGGTYSATLRLHYLDNELNGNNASTLTLWHYNGTWSSIGETANDTSNDWVEDNSIDNTTLPGEWTLAGPVSIVSWVGTVSNAWEIAGNWSVVQGSGNTPPQSGDIVLLGYNTFTNQPTINSAVTVKNIEFDDSEGTTLSIATGSLTTNGDLTGEWITGSVSHTINVGSNALTVGGDYIMSDGTTGHTVSISASSGGTININGNLDQLGGASVTLSGTASVNLGDAYNYTSGTFTAGNSTVTYDGAGVQDVAGVGYYNLAINKNSGSATVLAPATVAGALTVSGTDTLHLDASLSVTGSSTINNGAAIDGGSSTLSVGGNWIVNGAFVGNSGTVALNGTGSQSVASSTFNNLTINKSGGVATLAGAVTIHGNLAVSGGTLDLSTFTADHDASAGGFSLSSGTTLSIGTGSEFPASYTTDSLASTSTVNFYGTTTANVPGIAYGNLTLTSGSNTLVGNASVAGTFNMGGTFNGGSYDLTLYGDWSNSGSFNAGTGTVTLSGSNNNLIGATTFYNLYVEGNYTASNDITVDSIFTIDGSYSAGNTNVTSSGNFTNNSLFASNGTMTFSGAVAQNIAMNSGFLSTGTVNFNGFVSPTFYDITSPSFNNVNVNNAAGITPSMGWTVGGAFTVASSSTFNDGGYQQYFDGAFTNNGIVNSTGTLTFNPASVVSLVLETGGTSIFSSTGLVEFSGTATTNVSGTGGVSFTYVTVDNTDATGVNANSSWTLSADLDVASGSILNGGTGLSHLLEGNLFVDGTFNGGSSTVTMNNTGGAVISGAGTANFSTLVIANSAIITATMPINISGDFTDNGTFSAAAYNVTFNGSSGSNISGSSSPILFDIVTVSKIAATATLGVNIDSLSSLTVNTGTMDATTYTINQSGGGALTMNPLTSLNIGGTNTLPSFSSLTLDPASTIDYEGTGEQAIAAVNYGSLSSTSTGQRDLPNGINVGIAGSFTPGTNPYTILGSTVEFNGSGNQTIPAFNYYNLQIDSMSGTKTLASSGTIAISSGFTPGTNTYVVTGSTIDFNGSSAQSIPAFTYYNLTPSNSSSLTLPSSGEVGIAGTFTPGSATYTTTGSTIDYNGSGSQTITAFSYNNLKSSSSGGRTLTTSGIIYIGGTFTPGSNSYTVTGSTVQYDGSTAQVLPSGFTTYGTLELNNPAGVTGISGLVVTGTVEVMAGTFTTSSTFNTVLIDSAATMAANGSTSISVSGNWTNNGTFTANSGTVTFNGSGPQTLGGNDPSNFNNLTINATGPVNLGNDASFSGTLTLTSGTFAIGSHTFGLGGPISGTSSHMTTTSGSSLTFGGSQSGVTVPSGSNILNNITVNNSNGVSMTGNLDVLGTLTLTSGAFKIGANTLTLNNPVGGTATNLTTDSTGSLTFYGSASGITVPSNVTDLNNFTLQDPNGTTLQGALYVHGNLAIDEGTLADGGFVIKVGGNVTDSTSYTGTGMITLVGVSGASPTTVRGRVIAGKKKLTGVLLAPSHQLIGGGSYGNLELNDVNGASLVDNISVTGGLTLLNGNLTTNTKSVSLGSSATLSEASPSEVEGTISTSRNVTATSGTETFGGIGADITMHGTALGNTTVSRLTGTGDTSGSYVSILRTYTITPTVDTLLNADFTFTYTNADLNGQLGNALSLYNSTNNGASWTNAGGVDGTDSVSITGVNGFSKWTASDTNHQLGNTARPVVSSISPSSATFGGNAFSDTVRGANFVNTKSTVRFNGSNLTTTFVSTTELIATIPAADLAAAGTDSINVFATGGGGSSNSVAFTVNKAPTTTTFSSASPTGQKVGLSQTLTAHVSSTVTGSDTGTVSFYSNKGGTLLGTAELGSGNNASLAVTTLPAGIDTLVATYNGDTSFATSTSAYFRDSIAKGATSVTEPTTSVSPSVFGQDVTFQSTVNITSGAGTPTGTVTFSVDGTAQTPVSLGAGNKATFVDSTLSPATHSITAQYNGDPNFTASTISATRSQVVNKASTTTTLTSNNNPSTFGQKVNITAKVTVNSPGSGVITSPTGTITFTVDGTPQSPITAVGDSAVFVDSALNVSGSPHTISAVYSGDVNFNTSTSTNFSQSVNLATPSVTLSSNNNPSVFGQQVRLSVTVAGADSTPTGSVTFYDGIDSIGIGTLASGATSLNDSTLSGGSHTITAVYSGNSNFRKDTSNSVTQAVNKSVATLSFTGLYQLFTGSALSVTVVTNPSGLSGTSVTYNGSGTAPSALGSYQVIATLSNANYTATPDTATFHINNYINPLASGSWKTPATWSFGRIPASTDSVFINSGLTVTLDTNSTIGSLTIQGTLAYDATSSRSLIVSGGGSHAAVVSNTGTLTFNASGTNQTLTLTGNFSSTGTINNNSGGASGSEIVFSGTAQTVSSTSALGGVELNNSTLTANSNLVVTNELNLTAGVLILGSNNLAFYNGTLTGGSSTSYVATNGTGVFSRIVGTTAVSFPVGPSATSYNPVTLKTTTLSDTFHVGVIPSVSPSTSDNAAAIQRTFNVTKATASNDGNITMTLQWNLSDEGASFVRASAVSWLYNGGAWVEEGTAGVTGSGPYVATITGLTQFGHYTMANPGALPIQLAAFNGTVLSASGVELSWTTISQVNCYGFYVQRSSEKDSSYTTVSGLIPGAGTSLMQHTYTWTDQHATLATYYYRVEMVDLNGGTSYSTPIEVTGALSVGENGKPLVFKLSQNYPNPFNPSTTIEYSIAAEGHVSLTIYNILGEQVATLVDEHQTPGRYSLNWNASNYASGVYIYRLTSGANVQVHSMLLVK